MFFQKKILYGVFSFFLLCGLLISAHAFSSPAYANVGLKNSVKPSIITPNTITRSGRDPVVFVHGIDPGAVPSNWVGNYQPLMDKLVKGCDQYWGTTINYMKANHGSLTWGGKDFRTIKFYSGDTGCSNGLQLNYSSDLHSADYADQCIGYNSGNEGNFNENLYHLSCLFAWYMYYNFGIDGSNVEIVAHSMGGLIVHNAIYQVQDRVRLKTGNRFPPTLGHISDVVDFNSPHAGHSVQGTALATVCSRITQCKQMDPNSGFTTEMLSSWASNSQAGGTDWTLLGSECDSLVPASSATAINNVDHKVVYSKKGTNTCYNHGGALSDTVDASDALQYWCDWQDAGAAACNTNYTNFRNNDFGARSLYDMINALWSDQW